MLVLESMKMETVLRGPVRGRVARCFVAVNTRWRPAPLLRLEPAGDDAAEAESARHDARVDLARSTASRGRRRHPAAAAPDALAACASLLLGFDVDPRPRPAAARAADLRRGPSCPPTTPRLLAGEVGILQIFADLSELWRNRRVPGESQADDEAAVDAEAARNPQEYFHAYLRSLDVDAEGLPESFRVKLRRALAHYGVDDLEPSPDLEAALFRIFLAQPPGGRARPGRVASCCSGGWTIPESLPE